MMKHRQIFYLFIFIAITSFAQNYNMYSLYNNKLKAVFPNQPEFVSVKPYSFYLSIDKKNKMSFNAQYQPSPFTYEIREYNKNSLDETMINGLKVSGVKIIDFTSNLDKGRNKYTYIARIQDSVDDVIMYRSIKFMINGRDTYRWSVSSANISQQVIFDTYQASVQMTK
ncbi:MAG: hypothetical protein Q8T08_02580 [Ignavibacteria bacterium]|nr:hypothetical protein [Ignavibacteria bacterium]